MPAPFVRLGNRALGVAGSLLGFDQGALPSSGPVALRFLGWIAPASLAAAAGLMLIALAQIAGMYNYPFGPALFWSGTAAIVFPSALRIAWPYTPSRESLLLVLIMGMGLYGVKILHGPLHFVQFDEFLHWNTALNMMEEGRLFGSNSLLPISALYPALEIVATAFSHLSGLPIFECGLIVIGVGKAIFLAALFLVAEAVAGSSRVAGLACIVFMSNANFGTFHSIFSYESLAYSLMALTFLAAFRLANGGGLAKLHLLAGIAFASALAVTHHLTSYLSAAFLTALALLTAMEKRSAKDGTQLALLAGAGIVAGVAWWRFTGGPGSAYLGPVLEKGFSDFFAVLASPGRARTPFQGADGSGQPLWQKYTSIASYLLICVGLATGFFRTLRLAGVAVKRSGLRIAWVNSGLVLFTLLTILFPLSVMLRLTQSGWEVGNRLGSFASLGVCIVVAIAIAGFWQGRLPGKPRVAAIALALSVMVVGGSMVGWGKSEINYPYQVAADSRSVEPLGIGAAEWSRQWLGPGQRFAADRINQVLLGTFGRQIAITSLESKLSISGVLFSKEMGAEELNAIKKTSADYVMIDLRLTSALPVFGVYVDSSEKPEFHEHPPELETLLKFNKLKGVSRPFDNGAIIIYDVRALHAIQ